MKQACKFYRVPYIDIEELFVHTFPRVFAKTYYSDSIHYGIEFSRVLARFLKEIRPYCREQWEKQRRTIKALFHFDIASNLNCIHTDCAREVKGTALIKQNCYILDNGRKLDIVISEMYLCSVLGWFTPGISYTYITGAQSIRMETKLRMPLFRVRDFSEYFSPNTSGFQMRVKKGPWDSEIIDDRYHDDPNMKPNEGAPIAVSDFLFCAQDTPEKTRTLLEKIRDLSPEESFLLPEHYALFSELLRKQPLPLKKKMMNLGRALRFSLTSRGGLLSRS